MPRWRRLLLGLLLARGGCSLSATASQRRWSRAVVGEKPPQRAARLKDHRLHQARQKARHVANLDRLLDVADAALGLSEVAGGSPVLPLCDRLEIDWASLPPGCLYRARDQRLLFNRAPPEAAASRADDGAREDEAYAHVCRDLRVNEGVVVTAESGRSAPPPPAKFDARVCAAAPRSELTPANNPVCNFSWYGGGLLCCGDGSLLLDADQPVPPARDTWRLKYRFYFEDGDGGGPPDSGRGAAAATTAARHTARPRNLFRVWWSTEATNNEYSVPKSAAACGDPATPPSECVHTIRSRFTGRDMLDVGRGCMVVGDASACANVSRIEAGGGAFALTYAAAHCHAPACLSMELWDADSGELVCRNEPTLGTGEGGVHDERGFVVGIAPCLWGGAAEGLRPPPRIRLDGNYTSVKRVNSTNGHWGVMALWQCRGAYLDDADVDERSTPIQSE